MDCKTQTLCSKLEEERFPEDKIYGLHITARAGIITAEEFDNFSSFSLTKKIEILKRSKNQ